MTVGDSGGVTLGGLIRDTEATPEDRVISDEVRCEIQNILEELNEREQYVMRLRFRLDGSGEATPILQDDIARDMKLSRERVRQIEIQAIKKLRALAQRRRLREFLAN